MKIAWDNKADSATLTAGSQLSTLPVTNIQNPHVSKVWGTAAGVESSYVVLDLGSSTSCSLVALLGTNLTASATIRIRASSADATGAAGDVYNSGVIAAGVKAGYGAIYKSFAAVSARYWRLDIEDLTLADNIEVGRVFLGPCWDTTVPQLYDWGVTNLDPSEVIETGYGQEHVDQKPHRRQLEFVIDFHTEAEMYGNAFVMARAAGIATDVLAIPDINGTYLSEQAVWGRCIAPQPIRHRLAQIYLQRFVIKERL